MPFKDKVGNIGTDGMRLYNDVRIGSRPRHFIETSNFIADRFQIHWQQV
jgi:hypothetical protein